LRKSDTVPACRLRYLDGCRCSIDGEEPEHPTVDLVAEIDSALNALDESVEDLANFAWRNQSALVDAKIEAERLRC
jgi:hypothetical protein